MSARFRTSSEDLSSAVTDRRSGRGAETRLRVFVADDHRVGQLLDRTLATGVEQGPRPVDDLQRTGEDAGQIPHHGLSERKGDALLSYDAEPHERLSGGAPMAPLRDGETHDPPQPCEPKRKHR